MQIISSSLQNVSNAFDLGTLCCRRPYLYLTKGKEYPLISENQRSYYYLPQTKRHYFVETQPYSQKDYSLWKTAQMVVLVIPGLLISNIFILLNLCISSQMRERYLSVLKLKTRWFAASNHYSYH